MQIFHSKKGHIMTETRTSPPQSIAVVGATGQQGGAVARELLAEGIRVKALVCSTESDAARALRDRGADLVVANLDDVDALRAAFSRVDGLFAMTTNWGENGPDGEVRHGRAIADAAAAANVPSVVYSSVGGAETHTGIPHFESKRRVEEYMLERLNVRFVRPTFFMDNLAAANVPTDDDTVVFRLPIPADAPLQNDCCEGYRCGCRSTPA